MIDAELIAYLDDHISDHDTSPNSPYVSGMKHTRYLVFQEMLMNDDRVECDCGPEGPVPVKRVDQSWRCDECSTLLSASDDPADVIMGDGS